MTDAKRDPDVFVVLKDGTSYGTEDGTPLCVDVSEEMARHRKHGRCVRYVPEATLAAERARTDALVEALIAADPDAIERALIAFHRARTGGGAVPEAAVFVATCATCTRIEAAWAEAPLREKMGKPHDGHAITVTRFAVPMAPGWKGLPR
jgi:hypothetical protein